MSADPKDGDQQLVCSDCWQSFVWTVGEQTFYEQRQLSKPRRCPACRAQRRQERDAGR